MPHVENPRSSFWQWAQRQSPQSLPSGHTDDTLTHTLYRMIVLSAALACGAWSNSSEVAKPQGHGEPLCLLRMSQPARPPGVPWSSQKLRGQCRFYLTQHLRFSKMFFSCFWDHCSLLIDKLFVQNSLEPCSSISGAFLPPLGALVHIAPYVLGTHNHSTKWGGTGHT